ncbi:hypothetical protein GGS24DRAFT_465992 [Hypoxylon argillaceum]|nr:hypothetical protein GGS24DRAFT_465992 [Hypoxylon argillaceum]
MLIVPVIAISFHGNLMIHHTGTTAIYHALFFFSFSFFGLLRPRLLGLFVDTHAVCVYLASTVYVGVNLTGLLEHGFNDIP